MGTITVDQGIKLYWLGRYTERAFTTMKSIENVHDKLIDSDPVFYHKFLSYFGLSDIYGGTENFLHSFIYDRNNPCSVMFSLERAYDNGIVLREEISTEALSYIQMAIDTLDGSEGRSIGLNAAMLPVEDIMFGFWGCIHDYVYDDEILDIIFVGKYLERLELYLRLRYDWDLITLEYGRLCNELRKIPKNSPYRYNTEQLSVLVEIIEGGEKEQSDKAIAAIGKLFDRKKIHASVV